MNEQIEQQLRDIKQSFRPLMDGAVAQSMRDKGLNYHLNWGVSLPRLREMADELKSNTTLGQRTLATEGTQESPSPNPQHLTPLYHLAIALWKENIRECKILATMTMPANEMLPEVVDLWMEQTETVEIAEQAAMNLYQFLPYAPEKAYQWMASPRELEQLCGFHVMSRIFMRGQEPNERGINEYIDQAIAALLGDSLVVRKAAINSLQRFAELGLIYKRLAQSALKTTPYSYLLTP